MLMLNYACDGGGCASRKPCPVCGKEPTATPLENSFYSYAELTEEQKIRFAAYQVFDVPKKASSKLEAAQRWIPVSEPPKECEMRVFKDGDAWCFVLPDFQDLQVSPSVWMKKGVLDKIYKELRSVRNERSTRSVCNI